MLRAADLYHTGIVVSDLEASMVQMTEVAGYRWTPIQSAQLPVRLADGERTILLRYTYSLDAPHIELVQAVPGTPWTAGAGQPGTVHHLGYFCDDLEMTSKRLEESGFVLEACAIVGGTPSIFAYYRSGSGVRIEIVDRMVIPDFAAYLRAKAPGAW